MDGLEINFIYTTRYFERTVHFGPGPCYSMDIIGQPEIEKMRLGYEIPSGVILEHNNATQVYKLHYST